MNARIRLLVVIRHPVGGIRTYIKYTHGHLDPAKYHLTVLTMKDAEGGLIKEDLKQFDIDYIAVEGKPILLLMVLKVVTLLRRNRFDLIHSQGFTAGIVSVLGNALSRVPHVVTSHDVFRQDQFPRFLGGLKRWLLGFFLTQADFIQSVSGDAQQNLVDFLPALRRYKNKLGIIMNGIDVSLLEKNASVPSEPLFREQLGLEKGSLLFGFLGRFMPQKGFEYLIDAVEILSKQNNTHYRFRIAAVNDGSYIREYKQMVETKGLSEYFAFTGFVPDVGSILKELDGLIVPSLWEAYGLVAAEAFILGCPVIASNCIGLSEVVQDTPAIVVQTGDADSLAKALRDFMESPEIIKQRALAFVSQARLRFDSRNTAELLDALFLKVIASRGRVRHHSVQEH